MAHYFTGLWRHPDFTKLWIGETISLFGSQISALALPLVAVLVLQASPAQMGLLGAVEFAPFLLFSLVAGIWVDRLPRRPILIVSNVGRAVLLGCVPVAAWFDVLSMPYLYGVGFLVGILTVFFDIAYQSYLPGLVHRDQLVEGNAKLEVSRSVAQVTGPPIAGGLVALVTAPIAVLLDAGSFLVSAVALSLIRVPEPTSARTGTHANMGHEIRAGLAVVFGSPLLRAIAGCTATSNFFGNVMGTVFLLYVTREVGLTPDVLGIILGVGSAGALIGATGAGWAARRWGLGRTIIGAAALGGIGALCTPLAAGPAPVAITLLVVGQLIVSLANPIYNINQVSLRQTITPQQLQGRMNASMRFLVWGTIPLGALLGGALGEWIGLRPTLVVGAVGMLLAICSVLFSPVRALRDMPVPITDEVPPAEASIAA